MLNSIFEHLTLTFKIYMVLFTALIVGLLYFLLYILKFEFVLQNSHHMVQMFTRKI